MGNTVMNSIPKKLHFSMPSHAGLEITYSGKTILLQGIGGDNRVFHIKPSFKALKLRRAVGIIDWRLWIRKTSGIIPINGMIVWICMCPRLLVVSIMSFQRRSTVASNFCIDTIAVLVSCFNFSWFTKETLIIRLIRTGFPSPAVCTSSAFSN